MRAVLLCVAFVWASETYGVFAEESAAAAAPEAGSCSYTFSVKEVSQVCSGAGGEESLSKRKVRQLTASMNEMSSTMEQLQAEMDKLKSNQNGGAARTGGSTYVRWGSKICPDSATLIYDGYTANSHFSHGGGVNYQCLPRNPDWSPVNKAGVQSGTYLYGTEYQWQHSPLIPLAKHDHDVPCAVCEVPRGKTIVYPAKKSCPSADWTLEYEGILMTTHSSQRGATFECVDKGLDVIPGGSPNQDGGLFYMVEAHCGSLPCPPYGTGNEILCVVCTK